MTQHSWYLFALASAFFAALTAIFGKLGVTEINSNMATFIRVVVILVLTFGIVMYRNDWEPIGTVSRYGALMLVLSGVATGLSWLCYYRAMQLGEVAKVAAIDKLSVVMVMLCGVLFLGEPLRMQTVLGVLMMAAGAMVLIR